MSGFKIFEGGIYKTWLESRVIQISKLVDMSLKQLEWDYRLIECCNDGLLPYILVKKIL